MVCLPCVCRAIGALYAPISDCDEVFNYWEPLHFSIYGSGAQTWEYSPQFALRSWVYILIHTLNALFFRWIYVEPLTFLLRNTPALSWIAPVPKIWVFYLVRLSLVVASALADAYLYRAVTRNLASRRPERLRAVAVLGFLCTSTGLVFNASAFLPSTFAMYLTSTASAALLDIPEQIRASRSRKEEDRVDCGRSRKHRHDQKHGRSETCMKTCIFCMVVAVVVGWPFVVRHLLYFRNGVTDIRYGLP